MPTRTVTPTCPICGGTTIEEFGMVDYTQEIISFTLDEYNTIVDTEWGDRDAGYDDVVTGFRCTDEDCHYTGARKTFVPPVGKVVPGAKGDDPAQKRPYG